MSVERTASVAWQGEVKTGSGTVTMESSGAFGPYGVSFPSRAGEPEGQTSPEELIAAAHASCFSMALSSALGSNGTAPEHLDVSATVTFSMDGGPHISEVVLRVRGQVPGVDAETFRSFAEQAKDGCPVSKLVAGNVRVSLDAALA